MDDGDLNQTVNELSNEAFELARAAAESGDYAAGEARARELNDQLTDVWPSVEGAPAEEHDELSRVWSDARLDVGYVLSGGELPTSTRLHQVVRDRSGS